MSVSKGCWATALQGPLLGALIACGGTPAQDNPLAGADGAAPAPPAPAPPPVMAPAMATAGGPGSVGDPIERPSSSNADVPSNAGAVPEETPGPNTRQEASPSAAARASAEPDASPMLDAGVGALPDPPAATCPATSALEAGNTRGSLDVAGTRRTYVVHVPSSYDGEAPVPLLFDMHGLFGSGMGQLRGSGTAAVADREGFITVYPDGIDNAWNVGPCCTFDRDVDDVGFMRALVEKLRSEACVDETRVYATGVSMGGGMSHYLACEAAETFAAVAPAAFDLLEEQDCQPSRPISVLSSRGTSDRIVPYAGGASNPPNGLRTTIHFLGAERTFEAWAQINGCTGSPSPSYDGCETYSECDNGVETTLCTAQGGGHTYGDPERAWEMLSKYRLR